MTHTIPTLNRVAGQPEPVDIHVGSRLRLRRTLVGLSQEKLGAAVGLTFQQIQKYERGANRIGASRLYALSRILGVEVGYFFEDMPVQVKQNQPAPAANAGAGKDPMARRETLELVRAYYRIPHEATRKQMFGLMKLVGGEQQAALQGAIATDDVFRQCDAVIRSGQAHAGTRCLLQRGHAGKHAFAVPAAAE